MSQKHIMSHIQPCRYCAGTGEEYEPGLAGDGWLEIDCTICEGSGYQTYTKDSPFGNPVIINALGMIYRNDQGQFCKIKK